MRLDSLFEEVAVQSIGELDQASESPESRDLWVSGEEGEIDVGEMLAPHLANGCDAAAFVVHASEGSEYLMAQA